MTAAQHLAIPTTLPSPPMPIIVGVPRSGTTLLRMMLDAHSALAIPPETGFLTTLADLDTSPESGRTAFHIMRGFHTWPDFHLDAEALREEIERSSDGTAAGAARAFYRLYAARCGKPRWGDKTPTYGSALDRIAALLPEAHFIHIIRDGRDVALSVRDLWFRPGDSIEACAADWASRIADTRALRASVASYQEIRYEALVMSAETVLRSICRFIDLPFEPTLLTYYLRSSARLDEHEDRMNDRGQTLVTKAQRRHNQRFVMEPPRKERVGRWRTELSHAEILRFEAVAGDWLDRLGYSRLSHGPIDSSDQWSQVPEC